MKAHLLYPDRDFDVQPMPLPNEADLVHDLGVEPLLTAMAAGDDLVHDVARAVLLHGVTDAGVIVHRQRVLADALAHPDLLRDMYAVTEETIELKRRRFWFGSGNRSPGHIVSQSVDVLDMLMDQLAKLRTIAETRRDEVTSAGMTTLLDTLRAELDDQFVHDVRVHLAQLRFPYGTRMSARLGTGNEGTDYRLHRVVRLGWRERLRMLGRETLAVRIADRDEAGFQALGEIRDRGLAHVAGAVGQATQHVLDFFAALRAELAFYVGALNLAAALAARGRRVCFPEPADGPEPELVALDLADPSLVLLTRGPVIGNDIVASGVSVIFVTGANRGGKSTALRSIGLAQLMMQSGLFVAARTYRADLRTSVFTHFKREEDATMTSGKLDEELQRMSGIVDQISPRSLLLCNESFASTNEREGSQIAGEIVTAMRDAGIKVVFVTHLFELADGFHEHDRHHTLFLRAPRAGGGERPFALVEAPPLPTSFGADTYERVFGVSPSAAARGVVSS